MKEIDPKIEDKINSFISAHQERRQFQDESEDLPSDLDRRFKTHIEEMTSELKSASQDYPSSKNFPAVMEEWNDLTTELNSISLNNSLLDRKSNAQKLKLSLLRSLQEDHSDLSEKLAQSRCNLTFRTFTSGV